MAATGLWLPTVQLAFVTGVLLVTAREARKAKQAARFEPRALALLERGSEYPGTRFTDAD